MLDLAGLGEPGLKCGEFCIHVAENGSDGGLLTTLLEMAFTANCGFSVDIPYAAKPQATTMDVLQVLFAEELGFVFQVAAGEAATKVERASLLVTTCL